MNSAALRKAAAVARDAGDADTADELTAYADELDAATEPGENENVEPAPDSGRTDAAPVPPTPAAIAAAEVAVIEATAAADIARMEAAAKIESESESESNDDGESDDPAPRVEHWFYRPLR